MGEVGGLYMNKYDVLHVYSHSELTVLSSFLPLTFLKALGASVRRRFRGPVVAITGSVGKVTPPPRTSGAGRRRGQANRLVDCGNELTLILLPLLPLPPSLQTTTCAMTALALAQLGPVHKTPGNFNNEVGGAR